MYRICTVFIILIIYCSGCNNNSVNITEVQQTVKGKVYNDYHQALPNVKVKIGEQVSQTSYDGSFVIENAFAPYDLIVLDSLNKFGYFFQGLTIQNPEINIVNPSLHPRVCVMNVNLPESIPISFGKLIFTDTNVFNYYADISGLIFNFNLNLKDDNPVTGKLIILMYSKNNYNQIISYDKFGFKDNITISPGGNITVNFLASDLTLKPGLINVNINMYQKYAYEDKSFYLNFGKNIYQNISGNMAFNQVYGAYIDFKIPAGLPLNFSTLFCINGFSDSTNFVGPYQQQFLVPNGIYGLHLDVEAPPALTYPPNNYGGVDINTMFSFIGVYNGVFDVVMLDSVSSFNYYYYTTQKSFDLKWINKIHNTDISKNNFRWFVESISPSYYSLDDLLNPDHSNLNSFNAHSYTFYFKTK